MSSTDTSDAGMYKMMGIVMGALVLFAVICAILARILGADLYDPTDKVMRGALDNRISPVGQVRTAAMAEAEGSAQATEVAAAKSPEDLYNGACAACHAAGVANAPKLGDTAAWDERKSLGLEGLVASVINGKGAMPARGGSAYTDEEIQRAVEYLTGF